MRLRDPLKLISLTHPILHLSHPKVESFTWNTLIRANAQPAARPHQCPSVCSHSPFSIFISMRMHGVEPDSHTFPFLLQSFISSSHLLAGKQVHSQILRFGFNGDAFVGTSLVSMYSCCGDMMFARQVFDDIVEPDLPSWNSVINGYAQLGLVRDARKLFDEMPERNVISWSCMINGCVRGGEYKEALSLFREMQRLGVNGVRPNAFTMSCVLSACGRLGALEHGKWAHSYIDKWGIKVGVVLGTSLIDMYAKCGSIDKAMSVFDSLGPEKDVMAWSSMISGLAMHGHGVECLNMFVKMLNERVKPNDVTFLGVLCACVHCGLVDEGTKYFDMMSEEFSIPPLIQHYGCMVDLYSRAGLIEQAWGVIKSMPMEPDVMIWGALLSGSRVHRNTGACEAALGRLIEVEPANSGAYVLLSNIYAKMDRWKDARNVRDRMEKQGITKTPGCSLVEIGGILHEFFVGDESHPETRAIYVMLEEIMRRLRLQGYIHDATEVLLDLDDEEAKQLPLSVHSEK